MTNLLMRPWRIFAVGLSTVALVRRHGLRALFVAGTVVPTLSAPHHIAAGRVCLDDNKDTHDDGGNLRKLDVPWLRKARIVAGSGRDETILQVSAVMSFWRIGGARVT